ncbi:hypothetical protein LCGC14_0529160 [marine sediment metagenome]|uniref:Uncharacterized protein n=1 Tax=marine sediment metagenome TaxID=412755 RepID=A0A0F9SEH2_9ZZZZ
MRIKIADGLAYFDRAEWGANPAIRGGYAIDPRRKLETDIHHTVIVDRDATPDLWETEAEVKTKMRQLQVIRSDITDVPYNDVGFLMANRTLIVCEGRGQARTGAHTRGRNTRGYGFAFEGDMEALPNPDMRLWLGKLNQFFGWVKYERGLVNLGPFYPHQRFHNTACPGRATLAVISQFEYQEVDMYPDEERREQLAAVQTLFETAAAYVGQNTPLPRDVRVKIKYLIALAAAADA